MPIQRFQSLPLQVTYSMSRRSFYYLTQSRFRGVIAAAFLSIGGLLASSLLDGTRSSYICPIVSGGASRMQSLKIFNLFVDSGLLIGVTELCRIGAQFDDARRKRALTFLGAGLLVSGLHRGFLGALINVYRASRLSGVFSHSGCRIAPLSSQANPCSIWSTLVAHSANPS